jgi:hypothetical protein
MPKHKEIKRHSPDTDARKVQTFLRKLSESDSVQGRAAWMVCQYCDRNATCGVCRLYQFLRTLQYHQEGETLEAAAKKAETQAQNVISSANCRHDRKGVYFIDKIRDRAAESQCAEA